MKVKIRKKIDFFVNKIMNLATLFFISIPFLIIIGLLIKSIPVIKRNGFFDIIFNSSWHPLNGEFGFLTFIVGTLCVTLISAFIAIPLSILTAIYISEYAYKITKKWIKPLIDLLASIPSVIYGVWGILVIIPIIKDILAPLFSKYSSGYCVLTAGIVLAIMIIPYMIHISVEVLDSVPNGLRETSLAMGSTKWQTVKKVVIKKGGPGILAGIILGISRALGETMAVLMVAGNVAEIPKSVFDPVYPIPALIANNYGEMMTVPLYDSALMLASLFLLIIVILFNIASKLFLKKIKLKVG